MTRSIKSTRLFPSYSTKLAVQRYLRRPPTHVSVNDQCLCVKFIHVYGLRNDESRSSDGDVQNHFTYSVKHKKWWKARNEGQWLHDLRKNATASPFTRPALIGKNMEKSQCNGVWVEMEVSEFPDMERFGGLPSTIDSIDPNSTFPSDARMWEFMDEPNILASEWKL